VDITTFSLPQGEWAPGCTSQLDLGLTGAMVLRDQIERARQSSFHLTRRHRKSLHLGPDERNLRTYVQLWAGLVIFMALEQLAATLYVPRGTPLTAITDAIALLLMSSALIVFLVNASASPRETRLFWMLLAGCWGARIIGQSAWTYFEVVMREEVPNPFVGDILLFLSNIPVLAALLLQPHLDEFESRRLRGVVDFLLLLLWWLFLYLFFVIPWQYIVLDEMKYGSNFNRMNGLLGLTLLLTLGVLWRRTFGRWKWFYGIFFGAQLLTLVSAYMANEAIDAHLYYPGSWHDVPYAAALASATIVGLLGFLLATTDPDPTVRGTPLPLNKLARASLLSLPVISAWEILHRNAPPRVAEFRELLVLGTIFVMAALVFVKQQQLRGELTKANQVLRDASVTDPLTGARNRRFFDATITGDASQALRAYSSPVGRRTGDLIFYMVDLDGFKEVNDRFGHDTGDKVLVEVTGRIDSVIRSSDILIRWGGDEFLIVSRYANRAEAAAFAARILTAVSNNSAIVASPGTVLRSTCSIGWAAFPWYPSKPDAVPLEAVLGLADRGVYEAKTAGKNRAIGVSPSGSATKVLIATAGDRVSAYSVQTRCVLGPPQPSANTYPTPTTIDLVALEPAKC